MKDGKLHHFDARTGLSVDCLPASKPPLFAPCERCAFVSVAVSQTGLDDAQWAHTASAHIGIAADGGVVRTGCLPTLSISGTLSPT